MIAPGMQVVCVWDWTPAMVELKIKVPTKGQVYTVRDLIPAGGFQQCPYDSIRLAEIRNENLPGSLTEASFNVHGFKPVKATSIDQFNVLKQPISPRKLERVG